MARVEIPIVVQKPSATVVGGSVNLAVSGASVQVNIRGGGPATVFAGETGATTVANPLTTTVEGRIDGWLDEGSYNLVVSGSGITTYTQAIDLVRGDGVGRFAAGSITQAALATAVQQLLVPTGTVLPFAGASAPAGWVLADGSAISRTTFSALFAAIGTQFGTGDGSTTFNVPDMRGRVAVGQSAAADASVQTRGASEGAAVGARRPWHTHTIASHSHSVPAHFHGKGTLAASGGSHGHTDTGHAHSASTDTQGSHTHVDGGNGFLAGSSNSGFGGFFVNGSNSSGTVWWNGTNAAGAHGHNVSIAPGAAQIAPNTHSHPNSEFSGSVGNTAGVSGDAALTSGAVSLTSDAQGTAYLALPHIIKT
jgi:microcystin-dependent protein